jgi:hypothetical protein
MLIADGGDVLIGRGDGGPPKVDTATRNLGVSIIGLVLTIIDAAHSSVASWEIDPSSVKFCIKPAM